MATRFIRLRHLKQRRACSSAMQRFERMFGASEIEPTYALCMAYAREFGMGTDFAWAAFHLIPGRRGEIAHRRICHALRTTANGDVSSRGDTERAEAAAYEFALAWVRYQRAAAKRK